MEANEHEDSGSFLRVICMPKYSSRDLKSETSHFVIDLSAKEIVSRVGSTRFQNVAVKREVVQEFHRSSKCISTLHELCFVDIVGQERLTISDMLIYLILGIPGVWMCFASYVVAESEEVGDIPCHNRDGEASDC